MVRDRYKRTKEGNKLYLLHVVKEKKKTTSFISNSHPTHTYTKLRMNNRK